MRRYLHAFAMCQSMFCAIPMPWNIWEEEARDKMLLFLPLVGLEIGILWAGAAWLCRLLCLPDLIRGLVLCLWPFLATGCIHLDGFLDVTDAIKSCRSLERRREILKDSHVGAFAVIGLGMLMLSQFALLASAPADRKPWILTLIPVVSRCCSALAVTGGKPMATSQYAALNRPKGRLAVLTCFLLGVLAAGFLLFGRDGWVLIGCMAGFLLALVKACRSLEGMNGDISGYALTLGELAAVAVYALI